MNGAGEFLVVSYLPMAEGQKPPHTELFPFRHTLLNVIPEVAYATADPPSFPGSSSLEAHDAVWDRLPDDVVPLPRMEAWGYRIDHRWDEPTIRRVGQAIVAVSDRYHEALGYKSTAHLLPWLPRFYVPAPLIES